jgi:hypothetical protein
MSTHTGYGSLVTQVFRKRRGAEERTFMLSFAAAQRDL